MSLSYSIPLCATYARPCHILTALYNSLHLLGYVTHSQYCTHHYVHYTKSQAHSMTYCATYITALSCAIAWYAAAHAKSCRTPTALHLQAVSIGHIMGSQHRTPQHDQPQVTPHTLSVTYSTAFIRLCHRPLALHTTPRNSSLSPCLIPTALHTARHSQGRVTSFGRYLIQLKQVCLGSHKL